MKFQKFKKEFDKAFENVSSEDLINELKQMGYKFEDIKIPMTNITLKDFSKYELYYAGNFEHKGEDKYFEFVYNMCRGLLEGDVDGVIKVLNRNFKRVFNKEYNFNKDNVDVLIIDGRYMFRIVIDNVLYTTYQNASECWEV